jgi:hypothetical protein
MNPCQHFGLYWTKQANIWNESIGKNMDVVVFRRVTVKESEARGSEMVLNCNLGRIVIPV